ncbi:MAG TPA: helix-turn-helix domain-containing protein [Rubrivivax sp.]|nr:helix-turn-helix domain-containing protein [Rubrivivax sp.]
MTAYPQRIPPVPPSPGPASGMGDNPPDHAAARAAVAHLSWSEPELRGEWASTPSFQTQVQRLADGTFRSDATLVQMPLLRIGVERLCGAPVRVVGQLADDFANACVAVGPRAILNGVALNTPSLHLHGAGARFDSTSRGAWWCGLLRLHRGILRDPDDPLQAWFDSSQRKRRVLHAHGNRLADLIMTLTLRAGANPHGLVGLPQALLLDDVVAALRDAIGANEASSSGLHMPGPASRRRLALAAEDRIRAGVGAGSLLTVEALCRELHTSERSLQLAFREQFDTNARAFVLSARLQHAHAMLLAAGDRMTLTEIATQSGVWHLGRFPRYYRDLFGCTPSEMQRRIWGRPVLERAA